MAIGVLSDANCLGAQLKSAGEAAATAVPAEDNTTSVWVVVALALLGSSVVAGLLTSVLGNLRAAETVRRDGYAKAVRSLIARSEYPYRVRRRVSDDPEVLSALASRGHDLQEQLAACRTWVASEHRVLGTLFEKALADIDTTVKPATGDAWNQTPINDGDRDEPQRLGPRRPLATPHGTRPRHRLPVRLAPSAPTETVATRTLTVPGPRRHAETG